MRVAQEHQLINASRIVKKKKETCILDIRETQWQKIGGVWRSQDGWSPTDPESVIKIEKWVEEITRIIPRGTTQPAKEEGILDHQLSAVEGHKKIEIDETKHTWKDAEVEHPKEEVRIGEEIEKEHWVPRAKIELALLLGAIIAGFFIYANRPISKTEDKIFIQEEFTKMEEGQWTQEISLPAIGKLYLYNAEWPKDKNELEEFKKTAFQIMYQYTQEKLERVNLTEKEERKRIEDINKFKRPMLIIRPENEPQTKLWVSTTGSIIKESKDKNKEVTWQFLKSTTITDIPSLSKSKK